MDNEAKLTLLIAKSLVDTQKLSEIDNFISGQPIDWASFLRLIQLHELIPQTYIRLKDKTQFISPGVYESLKRGYYFSLANNVLLWEEFLTIAKAFNNQDISFVPLKGLSFIGDIYPDIDYRSMVDIDILVKEEVLKLVEDVLFNLGYNKSLGGLTEDYWRRKQCHIAFLKHLSPAKNILVEIHWNLDFERQKNSILPQLWDRTKKKDIEGIKVRLLSVEDAIFSLALHKRRFGNILSLKGICDLACLINKFGSCIDWGYILKWSRVSQMRAAIYFSLTQVRLIDETLIPKTVISQLAIPFWKRKAVTSFILRNTFSYRRNIKNTYLKSHFLMYDSLWEPINYIINIAQEQFAKFYGIPPYSQETSLLYRMRFLYLPVRLIFDIILNLRKEKNHHGYQESF
jgi:hypothetical protein